MVNRIGLIGRRREALAVVCHGGRNCWSSKDKICIQRIQMCISKLGLLGQTENALDVARSFYQDIDVVWCCSQPFSGGYLKRTESGWAIGFENGLGAGNVNRIGSGKATLVVRGW